MHHAGNSSGIVDGAAAVLIGSEQAGKTHGFTPRARIVAAALSGADPTIMLTGPMPAARKALAKAGMTIDQIDLFEVNEAFAAVPMRFMKEMGVPHEKVNVNGGAIAMGHPLGATGAMILNTLIDELHRRKLRYGMARCASAAAWASRRSWNGSESRHEDASATTRDDGIATITFDEPGSPVNTMCAAVAAGSGRSHGAGACSDKDAIRGIAARLGQDAPSSPAPT